MKMTRTAKLAVSGSVLLTLIGVLLVGCQTSQTEPAAQKPAVSKDAKTSGKGGAQLWAENCIRCHNVRSPSTYSDAHWDVATMHMRIRANLTAEESRKILTFLQSAN